VPQRVVDGALHGGDAASAEGLAGQAFGRGDGAKGESIVENIPTLAEWLVRCRARDIRELVEENAVLRAHLARAEQAEQAEGRVAELETALDEANRRADADLRAKREAEGKLSKARKALL